MGAPARRLKVESGEDSGRPIPWTTRYPSQPSCQLFAQRLHLFVGRIGWDEERLLEGEDHAREGQGHDRSVPRPEEDPARRPPAAGDEGQPRLLGEDDGAELRDARRPLRPVDDDPAAAAMRSDLVDHRRERVHPAARARAAGGAEAEERHRVRDQVAVPARAHHHDAVPIAEVIRQVEQPLMEAGEQDRLAAIEELVLVLLPHEGDPARAEKQVGRDEVELRRDRPKQAKPERAALLDRGG
jgi:hypothetical protein